MKQAMICDLDGTLASIEWRRHYVMGPRDQQNWPAFFDNLNADAPVPRVVDMVRSAYSEGLTVILVSGRPDSHRYQTELWLSEHGVPYHALLMRRASDHRSDDIVKDEIYEQKIEPNFEVQYVIDDRPMVIAMWKRKGLKVIEVVDPDLPPIFRNASRDTRIERR